MYLVGRMNQPILPLKLPWCKYPTAADIERHGLYSLPNNLPPVDFESARKFRSHKYAPGPLRKNDLNQILELARIIACSFAVNEPMNRYVHPPKQIPENILDITHSDALGNNSFGAWTKENLLLWFVRLIFMTDPSHPIGAIRMNGDTFRHSLVIRNDRAKIIGGSLNITLPDKEVKWRQNDPFLEATFLYQNPIIDFIHNHEHIAIQALKDKYPVLKKALQKGEVGYIAMIARSAELPSEHTFELFISSFESFQKQGYKYMVIAGTNQWTGAACEALGAARIYFAPFRRQKRVATEIEAKGNEPFSTDGFISGKDSGLMIYTLKL